MAKLERTQRIIERQKVENNGRENRKKRQKIQI